MICHLNGGHQADLLLGLKDSHTSQGKALGQVVDIYSEEEGEKRPVNQAEPSGQVSL